MKGIYATILTLFTSVCIAGSFADYKDTPRIDVFQGERGTSIIVITWPDGIVERLKYDNSDVKKGSTGYINWFNDRYDAYEKRKSKTF